MKLLQSKLLCHVSLTHAFTCRKHNNIAFHVGDDTHRVIANHQALASQLHYHAESLVHMTQMHSNKVVCVNTEHNFTTPIECDAIITNKPNIPLMVMTADCTPILLYEKASHTIAAIHAGRVGAFQNIINNSITMMAEHCNSKRENIIAVLGPCICQNCYEVNEKIYEEAKILGYAHAVLQKEDSLYLHVNHILIQQLQECGVRKHHIEVMEHCTSCEHHTFFSYRADGGVTGRQAGIIMLRS
ncbi:MAG: peptidoglycan editing factor PgeF [Sulfurimonas sp.]|nr:MAG: peptidoglycan editing factor PgeF [Sulfurimonas sp.]